MAIDMNFWLGRKYALLQQQADAGTKQAETSRIGTTAAARVDNTRADLIPAESAANVAHTGAETGLLGEQTRWFGPEATARISQLNASALLDSTNAGVAKKEGLDTITTLPQSLRAIMGARPGAVPGMASVFSSPKSDATAAIRRRPGESDVDFLDRQQPPWRY